MKLHELSPAPAPPSLTTEREEVPAAAMAKPQDAATRGRIPVRAAV